MDDITRPEDGHCLGQDGLVHVFVKRKLLCDKSYFPSLITEEHHIVTEHANCPVCVIAARKRIEDLINPSEQKPIEGTIASLLIAQQIAQIQQSGQINQIINSGKMSQNTTIQNQTQAQGEMQRSMISNGLLGALNNIISSLSNNLKKD